MTELRTRITDLLDRHNIPYRVLPHSEPVYTVEAAARQRGVPVEEMVKSILLRDKRRRYVMACVLGNDRLSMRIHGMGGAELAKELKHLGASFLMGATSFNPQMEDRIVGRKGYTAERALAFARLAEAGLNDFVPGKATRLGAIFSPITPANVDEAFAVYKWARERHIYPVLAPTIIAGKALGKLKELIVSPQDFIDDDVLPIGTMLE